MCAFARACLALAYRFASCQKFRHLDHPSKFMASKTFAFWKTEQRLKFPQILDFENLDFFIGRRAYHCFHGLLTVFSFILFNVDLWCLKNLATTNFLAFSWCLCCKMPFGCQFATYIFYITLGPVAIVHTKLLCTVFARLWTIPYIKV